MPQLTAFGPAKVPYLTIADWSWPVVVRLDTTVNDVPSRTSWAGDVYGIAEGEVDRRPYLVQVSPKMVTKKGRNTDQWPSVVVEF